MQGTVSHKSGFNPENLFSDLRHEHHVLVAVSGGSDSVALLHLLYDWTKARNGPALSVATVDHGLRKESATEARRVGIMSARLGLPHIIGTWSGEKPKSGISQKARGARYQLLAEIAADVGATAITLGHNRDDQCETILMRAKRLGFSRFGEEFDISFNRGLAGMSPMTIYRGPPDYRSLQLFRPLLGLSKAELRGFLEGRGVEWIDDPTNEDTSYERIQMRKKLEVHPGDFPTSEQVVDFARKESAQRRQLAKDCAGIISGDVAFRKAGVFSFNQQSIESTSDKVAAFLVRILIAMAGGRPYLVSPKLAQELLATLHLSRRFRQTLGSAVIERVDDVVNVWREGRNSPVLGITGDGYQAVAWDGRVVYRFRRDHLDQELVMGPLETAGVQYVEKKTGQPMANVPRMALRTQPALFSGGNPVFLPFIPWIEPGFNPLDFELWTPALERFTHECDFPLLDAVNKARKTATGCVDG